MKDNIVYLVGPMTGWPNVNREAFWDAEKELKSLGFKTVMSPAYEPDGLDYEAYYMTLGMLRVDAADTLVAIDHFWASPGALREIMRAFELGKMVYVLEGDNIRALNLTYLHESLIKHAKPIDGILPLFWIEHKKGADTLHLSGEFAEQNYDVSVPFKKNTDSIFWVFLASLECFNKWNAMVKDAK